jgi:hypothetical protein
MAIFGQSVATIRRCQSKSERITLSCPKCFCLPSSIRKWGQVISILQ